MFFEGFEKYEKVGVKGGRPLVSLWGRGQMVFNESTVKVNKLERFKAVELFYSREKQQVGLLFHANAVPGLIALHPRDKGSLQISASAFFARFGVKVEGSTKKFELKEVDADKGAFLIDLATPVESTTPRRRKKKDAEQGNLMES